MKKIFIRYGLGVFMASFISSFLVTTFLMQKNFIQKQQLTKTPIVSVGPTVSKKEFLIKGSIPYWDQKEAFKSFEDNVSVFDYVNLFWYYLGRDGSVEKYQHANEDLSIISFAHENNVKVGAVITNLSDDSGKWDSKRVENIISNKILRQKHIENIVEKLGELNFDGVIIDYELLKPNLKDGYSNFIRELYQALQKENKILSIVLHPKTGEKVKGEEISLYQDWETLSKYSDQLQIMGYSEHSSEDSPGPVAGADWVGKIIIYSKSLNIPPEKIFLGIPLYGYDWDKDSNESARGLTFDNVGNLISLYNPSIIWGDDNRSPHFEYGTSHEVWFENARSVEEKIKLAQQNGLAGVTFWRLGSEDPKVWEIIKKYHD